MTTATNSMPYNDLKASENKCFMFSRKFSNLGRAMTSVGLFKVILEHFYVLNMDLNGELSNLYKFLYSLHVYNKLNNSYKY